MKKRDNILRLKYRLQLEENGRIYFKIIHQDEKLNSIMDIGTFSGWKIRSVDCPQIFVKEKEIFLKGINNHMEWWVNNGIGDQSTIDEIHKALEEMVKKVYGNCTVVKVKQ